MKGMIVIEAEKCLGCKTCELECAISHSLSKNLVGAIREKSLPRLNVEEISNIPVPIQCAHCDAAACVSACPTSAIIKIEKTGSIVINQKLCVGCKSCIIVCPYGIPQIRKDGKAIIKCDQCFEKLEKDEKPACVSGCPVNAIKFYRII